MLQQLPRCAQPWDPPLPALPPAASSSVSAAPLWGSALPPALTWTVAGSAQPQVVRRTQPLRWEPAV